MTWEKLEEAFVRTGLDYSRQGSYSEDAEYPPSFFTFWNFDAPNEGFYDNEAHRCVWFWQVYYYTNDPTTLYSKLDELIGYARELGFVADGRGQDIPSDRPDYFGRMVTLKYMQNDYTNWSE